MSDNSSNDRHQNNGGNRNGSGSGGKNGDYTRIHWNPPGTESSDGDDNGISSKNSTLALKTAIAVARAFDANCALRNPAKECTIPMFESQELIIGEPLRSSGFFTDLSLRGINLTRNLQHGEFSEEEEEYRERFAERSIDGHYAVKFLQKGLYNSVHAASAASDMMMETKILMNLAPHPNICQIYGVTAAGSDAFLSRGKEGFYIILDRLAGTMTEKLDEWREQQETDVSTRKRKGDDDAAIALGQYQKMMQRLDVALDVGSALLFLSDRQIVFHLRPDKIGFDVRYNRIKLCDFGQARENGQLDQAPSLTKTDDIRSLAYIAPEVLCQAPVTVAADVYAYGMVLWEILSLDRPFDRLSRADHFEKVVMNGERPPEAPMIPKAVQTLIEKCWNPHLRPTMKKAYDSVEEILLFQDDKPELSVFPVQLRPPLANASSTDDLGLNKTHTQEVSVGADAKPPRTLRRTQTEEAPFGNRKVKQEHTTDEPRRRRRHHSTAEEGATSKDRSKTDASGGRVSRKSRQHKSSNHEKSGTSKSHTPHDGGMKDRSRNSQSEVHMKDKSRNNQGEPRMKDDSRESQASGSGAAPMKDKSKQRSSRKSRGSVKKVMSSEEAVSQGTKTTATTAEPQTNTTTIVDKSSKTNNQSLPELLQENEGAGDYVGVSMKVMASPTAERKTVVKPTQTLPTITVADEGNRESEPGLQRSQTESQASSSNNAPAFGRSNTSTGQGRRTRK